MPEIDKNPHPRICVNDLPHPLSRPPPKIGTKEQRALSLEMIEPKTRFVDNLNVDWT